MRLTTYSASEWMAASRIKVFTMSVFSCKSVAALYLGFL